jgi:uncharacterized protein YbjT (DUF2867 family)
MSNVNTKKIIAVVGATGHQGGAVVKALQGNAQFKARALTRSPVKHSQLADEVVAADLNKPETLKAAFAGAYGVFLVTNFAEPGTDEHSQAQAAVRAAKEAGVKHFIWSTLPNVEAITGGTLHVPHFTNKAKIEKLVSEAKFEHHTFVIAPFFYQNLLGAMAPQKAPDGASGWAMPLDPEKRVIHAGDINELGPLVVGAFSQPQLVGNGEYLPLVGDFLSFNDIVATLNAQGHHFVFRRVPKDVFGSWFPGAKEVVEMLGYFEAYTYLGVDSGDAIALANRVLERRPTPFAGWAKKNFAIAAAA